jgi:hypothetical protein
LDCGSCGNACCNVAIAVTESTAATMNKLNSSITLGGPDDAYAAQMTYEGTLGFADLRPYSKPVDFIGQAIHTTTGNSHFEDSVSFTIAPTASGGSVIQAFSLSLIAGAYCDDGQNYFNIMQLVDSIAWSAPPEVTFSGSCLPPAVHK